MKIIATGVYNPNRIQSKSIWTGGVQNTDKSRQLSHDSLKYMTAYPVAFGARLSQSLSSGFEALQNVEGIICACCGVNTVHVSVLDEAFNFTMKRENSAKAALKELGGMKGQMHAKEKKLYSELRILNQIQPGQTFNKLLSQLNYRKSNLIEKVRYKKPTEAQNKAIMKVLYKYQDCMPDVEKGVFRKVVALQKRYPERSLKDLLKLMRPENLKILEREQDKVLSAIEEISQALSPESSISLKQFVNNQRRIIIDKKAEDPFSRKIFISELYKVTKSFTEREEVKKLLQLADNLPASSDNESAFIVKYSGEIVRKVDGKVTVTRREPKEIAKSFFAKRTKDHFVATAEGGADNQSNWIYMCGGCNSEKSKEEPYKWVKEHPEMIKNSQKQIDYLIDLANAEKVKKLSSYISVIAQTYASKTRNQQTGESLINIDLSKLKYQVDLPREKHVKYEFDPMLV